jgi:hypothetical protein
MKYCCHNATDFHTASKGQGVAKPEDVVCTALLMSPMGDTNREASLNLLS